MLGGEELTVRWALMYPDAYEVGVPNQGVMILYEVINERPDALAERTYAVWPDLEAELRAAGVPQLTVDAHRSVRDFDLFGISFSTELGYTNMLTALDLAGIPLHARDRTDGWVRRMRVQPITAFSGVLISCERVARNSSFSCDASSASRLACSDAAIWLRSSRSAITRSVTSSTSVIVPISSGPSRSGSIRAVPSSE